MSVRRWLTLASRVSQRGDLVRRGGLSLGALAERLLGPVLVDSVASGTGGALLVGASLTALLAVHGLAQSAELARTEARLYRAAVDSVLEQDVLQPSVLPDEEARAALFEGSHAIAGLLAHGVPTWIANLVASTVFAVWIVMREPRSVILAAAGAAVGAVALLAASRGAIERAQMGESAAWVALADGISHAFDGRLEIVAGGRAPSHRARFAEIVSAWSAATSRSARVMRLAGRLPLLALAAAVGMAVVVQGALRGEPAGQTLREAAVLASMSPPFFGVVQGIVDVARNARRVDQILALLRVDPAPSNGTRVPGDTSRVELRDVHFAYTRGERSHEALCGISFAWRAGEILALAGPNGSGKSTCLRALLGLGQRTAGAVLVDGEPLERVDIVRWRRAIGFLPQRPYLPPRASVQDCLRFVDADLPDERILAALERVGLRTTDRSCVDLLGARADELSVGQRHRVALARVLCRQARIFVLDEPDANLDEAGVKLVAGLVRELARDGMVIFAAHSQELLAIADRVLFFEAGRIVPGSGRRVASG